MQKSDSGMNRPKSLRAAASAFVPGQKLLVVAADGVPAADVPPSSSIIAAIAAGQAKQGTHTHRL